MKQLLTEYKDTCRFINQTKLSTKRALYLHLSALFVSLFIICTPILVCVNLLIFYNYIFYIIYGMIIILLGGYLLYRKFYLDLINKECQTKKKYKSILVVEGIAMFLVLTLIYFIVILFLL